MEKILQRYAVARGDGLHPYSPEEKSGVCPIDGNKIAICSLLPPPVVHLHRPVRPPLLLDSGAGAERSDGTVNGAEASYALVATADSKLARENTFVRTSGTACRPRVSMHHGRHGRNMRVNDVAPPPGTIPSHGFHVRGIDRHPCGKGSRNRVDLLVQKNLYSSAIFIGGEGIG